MAAGFFLLGFLACGTSLQAAPLAADTQRTLDLDALIALSIQGHPSIGAARAQLGAAKAEVDAARSQYYPSPSIQVLQSRAGISTILTLQQPLWAGGRLDATLNAAQSRSSGAEVSINAAQYTLALRVTAAWAAWAQARGRAQSLEKGVTLLTVYTESVLRRIAGGAAGEVDRELVAARLAQTQGDLESARFAERSALGRLAQMTGQPLRSQNLADPSLAEDANGSAPALPALAALVTQAMAHSAALKRLQADIEAAQHETQQKRSALWPTLNLRAQHQRGDSTTTGMSASGSRLLLALEYSPGAGLSAGANIDAAKARVLALQENLQAARRELTETVTTDYEDYQAAGARKQTTQSMIQANAQVLAAYDRLFVAGKRSWLDVINAARELIQAQTALADVSAQQVGTRARLRLHAGETP